MPKPNYGFEKRQRELEKKRKKADKAMRKNAPPAPESGDAPQEASQAEAGTETEAAAAPKV
jgi:hypothetical protein